VTSNPGEELFVKSTAKSLQLGAGQELSSSTPIITKNQRAAAAAAAAIVSHYNRLSLSIPAFRAIPPKPPDDDYEWSGLIIYKCVKEW
jgi:hypothetical protein